MKRDLLTFAGFLAWLGLCLWATMALNSCGG